MIESATQNGPFRKGKREMVFYGKADKEMLVEQIA